MNVQQTRIWIRHSWAIRRWIHSRYSLEGNVEHHEKCVKICCNQFRVSKWVSAEHRYRQRPLHRLYWYQEDEFVSTWRLATPSCRSLTCNTVLCPYASETRGRPPAIHLSETHNAKWVTTKAGHRNWKCSVCRRLLTISSSLVMFNLGYFTTLYLLLRLCNLDWRRNRYRGHQSYFAFGTSEVRIAAQIRLFWGL
jgi:hypothetical protein